MVVVIEVRNLMNVSVNIILNKFVEPGEGERLFQCVTLGSRRLRQLFRDMGWVPNAVRRGFYLVVAPNDVPCFSVLGICTGISKNYGMVPINARLDTVCYGTLPSRERQIHAIGVALRWYAERCNVRYVGEELTKSVLHEVAKPIATEWVALSIGRGLHARIYRVEDLPTEQVQLITWNELSKIAEWKTRKKHPLKGITEVIE